MIISIDTIKSTIVRLPFETNDIQAVRNFLFKERSNNLDVSLHPVMGANQKEWQESFDDGFFVLSCPQIDQDFIFVNEGNGRGLFGGKRRIVRVYLGDALKNEFTFGTSYKNLTLSLFSINNVFRGNGFLKGGAF